MNLPASTLERSNSGPERSVGTDVLSDESWASARSRAPWEHEVELAGEDYIGGSGEIVRGKAGSGPVAVKSEPLKQVLTPSTGVASENEPLRHAAVEDSRWMEKTVLEAGDIGSVLHVSWRYVGRMVHPTRV